MSRPKPTVEVRCKNCALMIKNGNKMYCAKDAMRRVFPYNMCLDFRVPIKEDGG